VVTDEFLSSTDTLNVDVVEPSLLVGTSEALGAAGQGEDRLLTHGIDGNLPGLVHTLRLGGGVHEHDDHEKNHNDSDRLERAAVGGVQFQIHFIVYGYFFVKCVKD
jgi:hypothetical protein